MLYFDEVLGSGKQRVLVISIVIITLKQIDKVYFFIYFFIYISIYFKHIALALNHSGERYFLELSIVPIFSLFLSSINQVIVSFEAYDKPITRLTLSKRERGRERVR